MTTAHSPVTTTTVQQTTPIPSALTILLSNPSPSPSTQIPPTAALPLEILHNLRHQHSWTDLRLHPYAHQQGAFSSHVSLIPTPTPAPTSFPKDTTFRPSISDLDLTYRDRPPPQSRTSHPASRSASTSSSTFQPLNTASQTTTTTTAANSNTDITLLSGHPPKPLYIHADLQRKLLKAGVPESSLAVEREWVLPTTVARTWTLRELCGVFDSLPRRAVVRVTPKQDEDGSFGGVGRDRGGIEGTEKEEEEREEEVEEEEGEGNRDSNKKRERKAKRLGGTRGAGEGGRDGKGKGEMLLQQHQDAKRVLLAMKAHEGRGGDGTIVYYIVQEGEVKPRQN